jgi:hypothetical protein
MVSHIKITSSVPICGQEQNKRVKKALATYCYDLNFAVIVNARRFENVPERALGPRLPVPAATNLREEGRRYKGETDAMLEVLD